MLVIGLTGGISSGKSTVSNMFSEMNIPIIDADKIAREVVEKGSAVLDFIAREFGEEILNSDGSLNRKALGAVVFKNTELREKLNSIIHPEIKQRIIKKIDFYRSQNHKCCVVDAALLIEGDYMSIVDIIILVYVDDKTQLERLMARDKLNIDEAMLRIRSQMPFNDKKKYAHYIIDNTKDLESTRQQLIKIVNEALNLEEYND